MSVSERALYDVMGGNNDLFLHNVVPFRPRAVGGSSRPLGSG